MLGQYGCGFQRWSAVFASSLLIVEHACKPAQTAASSSRRVFAPYTVLHMAPFARQPVRTTSSLFMPAIRLARPTRKCARWTNPISQNLFLNWLSDFILKTKQHKLWTLFAINSRLFRSALMSLRAHANADFSGGGCVGDGKWWQRFSEGGRTVSNTASRETSFLVFWQSKLTRSY